MPGVEAHWDETTIPDSAGTRVPGGAGCRRGASTRTTEECFIDRSGGPLDSRSWGGRVLRLLDQLPDRHSGRRHPDVEATPADRTEEVDSTRTLLDRLEQCFAFKPSHLIGDTAYGTAEMLGWMVEEKHIEPHVPVWDKTERTDGTFSRFEFEWCEQDNEYRCPEGKALRSRRRQFNKLRSTVTKAGTVLYRASSNDCKRCPMKTQCCPNTPMRKIAPSVHENARAVASHLAKTPRYAQSRRDRKKVEMLFAHLKRILKLDRLRLRGLSGAYDEFLLQNMRKMAAWLAPKATEAATTRRSELGGAYAPDLQPFRTLNGPKLQQWSHHCPASIQFFNRMGLVEPIAGRGR